MYHQHKETQLLLSASINENDPYKESKKRQIERWYEAHWLLTNHWVQGHAVAFQKVFSDQDCWESTDNIEKIKLNRYILGKKLLTLKTEDEEEFFLSPGERYRIACACCFEAEIKNIFEELQLRRGNISVEQLVNSFDEGVLMVFWSHVINDQANKLELNNDHLYVYGFRCAMFERIIEALEFFWDKLQSVDTLSLDQKESLLIQVALFKRMSFSATAEMIDFCLSHLNQDKYPELLKKDFEQNGGYSTISKLENEYFFESAKKLFPFLNTNKFDYEDYSSLISNILDIIKSSLPDNSLILACEDYLTFIWHHQEFENHKKYFLDNLTQTVCWSRNLLTEIVKINKDSTILSKIINALTPLQMKSIKENSSLSYEAFTTIRSKSSDNYVIREVTDLSVDRQYLQQEITSFREGDSLPNAEGNNPIPTAEDNRTYLFNPKLRDQELGKSGQ